MEPSTSDDSEGLTSGDALRIEALSIAAPAYNEAEGIEDVVLHWFDYLQSLTEIKRFEIVVCNDGSRDDTGAILDRIARQIPQLKPVHLDVNQGAAVALTTAIRHTGEAWVLLLDSDGQFPIQSLPRLVAAIQASGAHGAMGVRAKKDSFFTRFGTWSSGLVCNLFHWSSYRDFNSAFKLVRGPLLRSLNLEAKGLNYSTEVTSKLLERGVTLVEVEIDHRPRVTGQSSMRLFRGMFHRFLFVLYIGFRQLLLRTGVLRVQ
jgi:glycosyltransferase involved in cell wall biosynthesis